MTGGMIEAHGIGGPSDLPISLGLTVAGAVAALVVSFTVLVVAWRTPRYAAGLERTGDETGGSGPSERVTYGLVAMRLIGMIGFVFTAATAIFGENERTNPFFGIVYVWLWVGVVFASLLFGPVWRAISPVRTINAGLARLSGGTAEQGILEYPSWLGHWPAAIGLYTFVWMELVNRTPTDLGTVRLWCAIYVAVMLVGGAVFGSRFYENADPFEVYSTLVGSLSVVGRDDAGGLVLRSPLAGAAAVPPRAGLVAVVAVLFGSTAFDSFQDSTFWLQYTQGTSTSTDLLNNLALLAFCVAVGLVLAFGAMATVVEPGSRRRDLPDLFAHAVTPIIVGYIVAHYARFLLEDGWDTLILASDPLGTGADLLGTADLDRFDWLTYHPTFLANLKVAAVVVGHLLGVVAAHDRAVRLLPPLHQLTGQLAMLAAMIVFTAGGLYLLFAA